MPRRHLGKTGMEVSVMGLGCSPLGGIYKVGFPPQHHPGVMVWACKTSQESHIRLLNEKNLTTRIVHFSRVLLNKQKTINTDMPLSFQSPEIKSIALQQSHRRWCSHSIFNDHVGPNGDNWQIGELLLQEMDEAKGVEIVQEAYKLGINFFDTSPFYGNNRSEEVSLQSLPCPLLLHCYRWDHLVLSWSN